jgi:hypothetical protein
LALGIIGCVARNDEFLKVHGDSHPLSVFAESRYLVLARLDPGYIA